MEINPNRPLSKFNKTSAKKGVSQTRKSSASSSSDTGIEKTAGLSGLQEELEAMPEVRQERLDEGKVLKDDPNYPDKKQLRQIGKLVLKDQENKETVEE